MSEPEFPEAPLIAIFKELHQDFVQVTLEDLMARMEIRVPTAIKHAFQQHGELTIEEAANAAYLAGLMDAVQNLNAGEDLIREALEIAAGRVN
jgi:hypothetical protein